MNSESMKKKVLFWWKEACKQAQDKLVWLSLNGFFLSFILCNNMWH